MGPEATATSAFKHFLYDLIRDMLSDIYQVNTGTAFYLVLHVRTSPSRVSEIRLIILTERGER